MYFYITGSDLKISLEDRFRGKCLFFNDFKVIKNINSKLSSTQKELFGSISFGPFLNLSEFKCQGQLFHHLFMSELK